METNILGLKIYNKTKNQLLKEVMEAEKINIISGNPEILNTIALNSILLESLKKNDSIIIPDGIGTVISSKIVKAPVMEKIAGIEVMEGIIKLCEKEEKGIYLLGAKKEILEACMKNLKEKYSDIMIVGSHDGYFDIEQCEGIIDDIKEKKPYALFVAMGCPKQEVFIIKHMKELPCKVFMGVGGSFDVFAGKVKRAPKWMITFGLEWLYRVAKEPCRIKRLSVIPKFLIKVGINEMKNK